MQVSRFLARLLDGLGSGIYFLTTGKAPWEANVTRTECLRNEARGGNVRRIEEAFMCNSLIVDNQGARICRRLGGGFRFPPPAPPAAPGIVALLRIALCRSPATPFLIPPLAGKGSAAPSPHLNDQGLRPLDPGESILQEHPVEIKVNDAALGRLRRNPVHPNNEE